MSINETTATTIELPESVIDSVIDDPNQPIDLPPMEDIVEHTVDNNGYFKHLLTELAVCDQTLDDYPELGTLKQVIFTFWNEGYSGGFAGYARVALIHWIRTIAIQRISKMVKTNTSFDTDWIGVYDASNTAALADKDVDGMFAVATRKQLADLVSTNFNTLNDVDQFLKYLECAIGFQLLGPLTGNENEWVDQTEASGGNELWQNNRCGAVFKGQRPELGEGLVPYYLDGFVFSDDRGMSWFTSSRSAVAVTFPYIPRTVYCYIKSSEDQNYTAVTEWDRPLTVGMALRHHEGVIYEVISIIEGQVALRDNNRQMVKQVPITELTTVHTEQGITYPNYFPMLTREELDILFAEIDAKADADRQVRIEALVEDGWMYSTPQELMPRFETQAEFEAGEAKAAESSETVTVEKD